MVCVGVYGLRGARVGVLLPEVSSRIPSPLIRISQQLRLTITKQRIHPRDRPLPNLPQNRHLRPPVRWEDIPVHMLWAAGLDVADDGVLAYGRDEQQSEQVGAF